VAIETARAARDVAKRLEADCCVALGGGSTIGLGKAIALESALPIVAVPTEPQLLLKVELPANFIV